MKRTIRIFLWLVGMISASSLCSCGSDFFKDDQIDFPEAVNIKINPTEDIVDNEPQTLTFRVTNTSELNSKAVFLNSVEFIEGDSKKMIVAQDSSDDSAVGFTANRTDIVWEWFEVHKESDDNVFTIKLKANDSGKIRKITVNVTNGLDTGAYEATQLNGTAE